jgi:hypothetical protein
MGLDIKPMSLESVRTYPLSRRPSKVSIKDLGRPWQPGRPMVEWLETLPSVLAAGSLKDVVGHLVRSVMSRKTVILAMGAHPVKVGLSPIIVEWMEKGILTGVAMNGAGIIHDAELAMAGHTSEEVDRDLEEGAFGAAEETGRFLNEAIKDGAQRGWGLGRAVGAAISEAAFPYGCHSILGRAHELGIPVTVHVAIGADVIHFHPSADGAAIGKTSHMDFRLFARLVSGLEGGIHINLGSAVILPEVFLKALSLVRNLGYKVKEFVTVNMDFTRHYRSITNVVERPVRSGGKGYNLIGHHEIMFPLLAACLAERLAGERFVLKREKENANL